MTAPSASCDPVLDVRDLTVLFGGRHGTVRAVDGISFHLSRGETLGIVGESGCGKSVTALSILRLIPTPPGRIAGGSVRFEGRELTALTNGEMRRIRGNYISMIFQEPMTSLNPVLTVGRQIAETIMLHQGLSRSAALAQAVEMLEQVRMPDAAQQIRRYPHALSGGMRQRVMIAMALSCNPKVLIADEPTTALDVTIQAQILALIHELKEKLDTAVILITHDLGVIADIAERVIVMYAGRKVEESTVDALFAAPRHPYTVGLMGSVPRLPEAGAVADGGRGGPLAEIPGAVPRLDDMPAGCAFAPRCGLATERCRERAPTFEEKAPGQWAACWESHRLAAASHA